MTFLGIPGDESVAWALERELWDDLPITLRLDYDGEPVSKARARVASGHSYTPERTKEAEERIAWLARAQGVRAPRSDVTFGLFAKFFCGTWQRRDVDNMVKLVADALTGIVWADDSQVSEMSAAVRRGVDSPRTHLVVYETRSALPPTRPCEVCGVPVRQYPSQPNRYCSKEHAAEGQRATVTVPCPVCGKPVTRKRSYMNRVKNPTCSEACKWAQQRKSVLPTNLD